MPDGPTRRAGPPGRPWSGGGREELAALLAEKGEVLIQDEVCNHEYRYGAEILEQLFPTPKRTLH